MDIKSDPYYAGLSGLQLQIPKYLFPHPFEETSRLTYYASIFNSIEVNSSFYSIPHISTITKWAASVPEKFKFTFKLWKGITHNKILRFKEDDVLSFFKAINAVQDKKGCLLIQLPPSLAINHFYQLDKLLICMHKIGQPSEWKIAVECRHSSWYHQSVYDLLMQHNVSIVMHDIPKSATPFIRETTDFVYVRFHGPTGNYRGCYTEDFLSEYASYIHRWVTEGKTVYAYFNNTMGEAFNNLSFLNTLICDKQLQHVNFKMLNV
jgi:uncharacterized protein YecE (DUF72 family)